VAQRGGGGGGARGGVGRAGLRVGRGAGAAAATAGEGEGRREITLASGWVERWRSKGRGGEEVALCHDDDEGSSAFGELNRISYGRSISYMYTHTRPKERERVREKERENLDPQVSLLPECKLNS